MTWRNVWLFWIGAILLGGWLYLDSRTETEISPREGGLAPLLALGGGDFDELEIVRLEGTLRFVRRDDRWVTLAPEGTTVTSDLLAALIDTLATIPPIERLTDGSQSPPEFGLDPALTRIVLLRRGTAVAEVGIGKRNPTRTAAYAALSGQQGVYLIGLNAQYYLELVFDEIARQKGDLEREARKEE